MVAAVATGPALALLAFGNPASAQSGLVTASHDVAPPTRSEDAAPSDAGEVGISDLQLSLNYGIALSKTTLLAPGVSHRFVNVRAANRSLNVDRLHAPMLRLSLIQELSESWSAMLRAEVCLCGYPSDPRLFARCSAPKSASAASALCARQRRDRFAIVEGPPFANAVS